MEDEPYYEFRANGELIESNRQNTCAYTFFGELAIHDHVFIANEIVDERTAMGTYIFKDNPLFKKLACFIIDNHFPMILNQTNVPELDEYVWREHFLGDFENTNTVPEEWSRETPP